jgi:hypothetical protein
MEWLISQDGASVAVRAVAFILLFQASGVAIFVALFARPLEGSLPSILRAGRLAAVGGIVATGLHLALESARLAGTYAGMIDPALQGFVLRSEVGTQHALQLLGLLGVALGLRHR